MYSLKQQRVYSMSNREQVAWRYTMSVRHRWQPWWCTVPSPGQSHHSVSTCIDRPSSTWSELDHSPPNYCRLAACAHRKYTYNFNADQAFEWIGLHIGQPFSSQKLWIVVVSLHGSRTWNRPPSMYRLPKLSLLIFKRQLKIPPPSSTY